MRIGIDATCWANKRGYGRYARGLISVVLANPAAHEFILFTDSHTYTNVEYSFPQNAIIKVVDTYAAPSQVASSAERRSLRDMWAMSTAVSRTALDVMFFPTTYTYYPVCTTASLLVCIHDVIADTYPDLVFPKRKRRLLWNFKNWLARRQADIIITVSAYAQTRIINCFNIPYEQTWVVGEAADPVFQPVTDQDILTKGLSEYGLNGRPYLICLGGLNPHKNIKMLLHILAELTHEPTFANLRLVLVGPAEGDIFTPGVSDVRNTIHSLGLKDAVHLTGFIPDEKAAALLSRAKALVMPSVEEGFGLGAVEAAACGTPVIATQNSPLPTLLKGGGFFADPNKPGEWKDAIKGLLCDEETRRQMGEMARQQAGKLTWSKAAEQFHELLGNLCDN